MPIFGLWSLIFIMKWSLWPVAFPRNLFFINIVFFLLEILLNDLEIVFLELKHINTFTKQKEQIYFLFTCSFFTCCFILILCMNAFHLFVLFLCVKTQDESVLFWIVGSQSLYVIMLSTFYTWTGSLKWTPLLC